MSRFTDWIEDQLREKEWSQNELARRSGVTSAAMSKLMAGASPGLKISKGLAKALDVTPQFILELAQTVEPLPTIDRDSLGDYERKILEQLDGMPDKFKLTVLKTVKYWRFYVEHHND